MAQASPRLSYSLFSPISFLLASPLAGSRWLLSESWSLTLREHYYNVPRWNMSSTPHRLNIPKPLDKCDVDTCTSDTGHSRLTYSNYTAGFVFNTLPKPHTYILVFFLGSSTDRKYNYTNSSSFLHFFAFFELIRLVLIHITQNFSKIFLYLFAFFCFTDLFLRQEII